MGQNLVLLRLKLSKVAMFDCMILKDLSTFHSCAEQQFLWLLEHVAKDTNCRFI